MCISGLELNLKSELFKKMDIVVAVALFDKDFHLKLKAFYFEKPCY